MRFLLLSIFLMVSFVGNAQTYKYEIRANNHSIGILTATKTESENGFKVEVRSDVKVHLFVKTELSYILVSNYKNNELVSGKVIVYVNRKVHSTTSLEKTGNFYSLTNDDDVSKYYKKILYSSALYYFTEPNNISNMFSEFSNSERTIKAIGDDKYEITDPDSGHVSKYSYSNGILQNAVIHHTLMSFELIKK